MPASMTSAMPSNRAAVTVFIIERQLEKAASFALAGDLLTFSPRLRGHIPFAGNPAFVKIAAVAPAYWAQVPKPGTRTDQPFGLWIAAGQ
jgi:hypothetical protein